MGNGKWEDVIGQEEIYCTLGANEYLTHSKFTKPCQLWISIWMQKNIWN